MFRNSPGSTRSAASNWRRRYRRCAARQMDQPGEVHVSRESTMGFCDVVFGWDIGDVLYDNEIHGLAHRLSRCDCTNRSAELSAHPMGAGTALFLLDFVRRRRSRSGSRRARSSSGCWSAPRHRLRGVNFSAEYEFSCSAKRLKPARKTLSKSDRAQPGHVRLQHSASLVNAELAVRNAHVN